jgi:hypothetical protein
VRSPKKRCTVGGPLDPVSTVPLYRCPSGPPGPALARARLGPAGIVPGLARHYDTSGRVGAAHGPISCRVSPHSPALPAHMGGPQPAPLIDASSVEAAAPQAGEAAAPASCDVVPPFATPG